MRRRGEKRSRWWNEEVREVVRKKKLMYRRLLDTGSKDARRHYKEVNVEARIVVRRNKNDEWIQLGTESKNAWGDQRRFWA